MNSARLGHAVKCQPAADEGDAPMISRMEAYCAAIPVLVAVVMPMSGRRRPDRLRGGGPDATSIHATVNDFRAAAAKPNNGNAPGPLFTGRRAINWDGGGQATTNTACS
jgi:hypothetical protein